jgi:hypothetical protein
MRITPELELNVAEAVKDPQIGLQGAALLLLCYDLSNEDRIIFASEEELLREFQRQSMELISRVAEIETRMGSGAMVA